MNGNTWELRAVSLLGLCLLISCNLIPLEFCETVQKLTMISLHPTTFLQIPYSALVQASAAAAPLCKKDKMVERLLKKLSEGDMTLSPSFNASTSSNDTL